MPLINKSRTWKHLATLSKLCDLSSKFHENSQINGACIDIGYSIQGWMVIGQCYHNTYRYTVTLKESS